MEDEYTQTDEQMVSWNLSAGLVSEIMELLRSSNNYYLQGFIPKAFWHLKACKFRFIQNLTKQERKDLLDLEIKFNKAHKDREKNLMAYHYEMFNEKIMDLLESYGYTIPKSKSSKTLT